jgi:hypothetical protein
MFRKRNTGKGEAPVRDKILNQRKENPEKERVNILGENSGGKK